MISQRLSEVCLNFTAMTKSYKVTVSALTNGPIPVDSTLTVTLFCTIDPTPPMPLSYVWYSSAPGNYINNQGPSATVYIFPRERKLSLYFCHVQSNESDVAVGYISIEPQGFLIPIGPTVVTYHYGDNIALEVSLSSNPRAQYIQSLQWYKDGNPLPVNCSSDMGVCTNTTGTRLTIQRAGKSDEGQYTVTIKNIQGVNSYGCIQNLLSLLEGHYAAHSPVTFTVSLQAVPPHPSPDSPVIVITCAALNGTPDVHNITLMKNGSVLETVVGGNTLSYTVTWSGLGQYVCEVDSLYSTHQESIVLMESGSHDAEQAMAKLQLMSCKKIWHTYARMSHRAIVIYSIAKVRKSHDTVNEMHRVDFRRMALRNIILVEADDNPAY
ncbi:hypothetical protein EMCRGX_G008877 [Ephydatia muelleri]